MGLRLLGIVIRIGDIWVAPGARGPHEGDAKAEASYVGRGNLAVVAPPNAPPVSGDAPYRPPYGDDAEDDHHSAKEAADEPKRPADYTVLRSQAEPALCVDALRRTVCSA
jgi:hypothetical protein